MAGDNSYDALLNTSYEDLQEDKVLPTGQWLLRARNATLVAPKTEGQSSRLLVFYNPVEPLDDVDTDELAALGDEYDFTQNDIVMQRWIESGKDMKRALKLIADTHAGADVSGSVDAIIKDGIKGAEVVSYLDVETYENKNGELVTKNTPTTFERPK